MAKTHFLYRLQDDRFTFLHRPNLSYPFHGPTWIMPRKLQRLVAPRRSSTNMPEKIENLNTLTEHKKAELQERNQKEESLLCELPQDVIVVISNYLHYFCYLNFRASCKTIHSAIPRPQWGVNTPYPLFMFSKDGEGLCELRDPFRNDVSHSIIISHYPQVPTGIEFSKDGWLVLCTGGESLQFFNPFTKVRGEFTPFRFIHWFESLGFSTYPISSDCLTVGILDSLSSVLIASLSFGDETWKCHDFDQRYHEFEPSKCSPAYHKEAFYFLDRSGHLGEFKMVSGKASTWASYETPIVLGYSNYLHSCHLVECDEELLTVLIGELGRWIRVFKFNHLEHTWDELQRLENHILFIGLSSSFCTQAKEDGTGNRIYLPLRMGSDIVFDLLETKKYHIVGSVETFETFNGMEGQSFCCWI